MEDFTVTHGTAHYEHKTPGPVDYDNKAPFVTLNFTVAEGSDPAVVTKKVMGIAIAVVEQAIAARLNVSAEQATEPTPEASKTRQRRVPNPVPPTPPTVPDADHTSSASVVEDTSAPGGDPSAIEDDSDILGPQSAPVPVSTTISDEDLHSHAQREGAKVKEKFGNINKVRELITACGGEGHLLQIPQDRRAEFVDKLKGLVQSD